MENIGGSIYHVLDASEFNFENVQFVMSEADIYGNQVVQMQAPNQAELVEPPAGQQTQQPIQQVVYQTQEPNQTYVLQQPPPEPQHIPQPVVFQTAPVSEEQPTEQPVFYTELQTPREQAQAALTQQQQQVITQQNHLQQVILNQTPDQNQQQFVTHSPATRPVMQHHSSPPQMTIIQQQSPNQQQQYYVAAPHQQYYIQQSPHQVARIVYDPQQIHQAGQQRTVGATLVLQQQPRMQIQPQIRQMVQQQPGVQQTSIVRMGVPRMQQVQTSQPITLAQRPRPATMQQVQARPRVSRPRGPRPGLAVTRPRTPNAGQNIMHPTPQNVKVSYITTPTRQTPPQQQQQRMIIQRTLSPNRVVLTRPAQRVVLQTTPRFTSPPPQPPPPTQLVTIKKTVQKTTSDDPDDIESSITAAIVSRKPDGTPLDPAEQQVAQAADIPGLKRQPTAQMRQPMLKKVTGPQTPIISSQLQKQEEESKERESAKMLVILQSGEQRLITFTLPKECCTVQELLEQVGVPFSADSNIQCISNPGADIDYVVTVGVTVDSNELMVVAENTMKQPQVQASQAQQIQLQMQPPTPNLTPQQLQTPSKLQTVPLPDPNETKPKLVKGYLAVCNYCGATSIDHAKCQRCRRVFKGDVKIIPLPQTPVKPPKQELEGTRKIQLIKQIPNSSLERGEITATRGRGSGRPRATRKVVKPEEPVILTLSSDEEPDDEKQFKSNDSQTNVSNMMRNVSMVEPLKCEPTIQDNSLQQSDFRRDEVSEGGNCFNFKCRAIRIGQYKFDSKEKVTISDRGIKIIAPTVRNKNEGCAILNIQLSEIVKMLYNFNKKSMAVVFVYVIPSCGNHIRESLEMGSLDTVTFNPCSRDATQTKIVLHLDCATETMLARLRSAFDASAKIKLEEIPDADSDELLKRSDKCTTNSSPNAAGSGVTSSHDGKQILIYPQGKGGMTIYTEDYLCLAVDQYLNDVIIDFYLKYLLLQVMSAEQQAKTHVFSTFFYKRLTTIEKRSKLSEKDPKLTPAQKRHQRVKNWSKNVDLFKKDFIIIPINEQSHWFLAIVCFPALNGPVTVEGNRPVKTPLAKRIKKKNTAAKNKLLVQIGNTTITPVKKDDTINVPGDESERDEAEGDDSELNSDDSGEEDTADPESQPIKQPCILIFDSLAGTPRSRVVATLRDYLTCEWRAKVPNGATHTFNKDNLPGHSVKVPQQNNFTDCGLYLLQYVEHFFKEPIRDYRIPIKGLQNWFEAIEATKKREDISNLLVNLIQEYKPGNLPLPEIEFPTIGGKLIEEDSGEFEDGNETDGFEDPDANMEDANKLQPQTQVKITRQIKFTKRSCEEKPLHRGIVKTPRLDDSA